MFLVDTNVISELMRPTHAASVAQWFDRLPLERLVITAVTVGEILYGLDRLPDGRRKIDLAARFVAVLRRTFFGCALPFDDAAAGAYARIRGDRDRMGRPIGINDATIVTRNVADFEPSGLAILDAWA